MKTKLLSLAVVCAFSAPAFAESNVTLYGVIDGAVTVTKHKHQDTKVIMDDGIYAGSRFGFKGTEDLGNGYSVGFKLEQGFKLFSGEAGAEGKAFNRESILNVTGGFGHLAFGRAGALSSDCGTYSILKGTALYTSYYTDGNVASVFINTDRYDNMVIYQTPEFSGATITAMYSNGTSADDEKWSLNSHYYGIGLDYSKNDTAFSVIYEMLDNKDSDAKATQLFTIGGQQGFGNFTLYAGYQLAVHSTMMPAFVEVEAPAEGAQNKGVTQNAFTASIGYNVWGGEWLLQGNYAFGKNKNVDKKYNIWSVGTAYQYPISKRTMVYAYGGYGQANKYLKNNPDFNSWTLSLGLNHNF